MKLREYRKIKIHLFLNLFYKHHVRGFIILKLTSQILETIIILSFFLLSPLYLSSPVITYTQRVYIVSLSINSFLSNIDIYIWIFMIQPFFLKIETVLNH